MTETDAVRTERAPDAVGPYSQGVRGGGFVFTSGQLPFKDGTLVTDDIECAARAALANVDAVLRAGGATLADVVKVTIYLSDMSNFAAVNAVYAKAFREPFPARSCVEVSRLPLGAPIVIEAVAVVG
jgi:2-iminobutanoate/2-iminopropanoate deaminase